MQRTTFPNTRSYMKHGKADGLSCIFASFRLLSSEKAYGKTDNNRMRFFTSLVGGGKLRDNKAIG